MSDEGHHKRKRKAIHHDRLNRLQEVTVILRDLGGHNFDNDVGLHIYATVRM